MLKATFDIIPDSIASEDLQNNLLLMEVSDQILLLCIVQPRESPLSRVSGNTTSTSFLAKHRLKPFLEILSGDQHLQLNFAEAYLVYHYTDSNLLPEKYFTIDLNKPVTEIVYGECPQRIIAER